jgi:spore coat protein YsxE
LTKLEKVLSHYGMYPYQGEPITSKVMKIYTGNQYVMLKRTKKQNVDQTFSLVYKLAKEHNLTSIAPLYLTKEQKPFVEGKKHAYYVMPWLNERKDETITSTSPLLFKEIGNIHQKTMDEKPFEMDNIQAWVNGQKERVKKVFQRYEKWMTTFEAKHFMSPTELLLCHFYRKLREVCQSQEYWYDEWRSYISTEKTIRSSLCHGALTPSHSIHTNNGIMFINWENAYYGQPVTDLSDMFHSMFVYSDINFDEIMDGFSYYKAANPLLKNEIALFALSILNPNRFIENVKRYVRNPKSKPEMEWVRLFQQHHFYFDHALYLQNHLKNELMDEEIEDD